MHKLYRKTRYSFLLENWTQIFLTLYTYYLSLSLVDFFGEINKNICFWVSTYLPNPPSPITISYILE